MVKRPDPLESTPPAFGEQAARQILREGFGVEASSLTRLAGERDQNFRVDTGAGKRFLFKTSNPADDEPILAMQAAAFRHIEQVDPGLPVMRALPSVAGESWGEVPGPDGRGGFAAFSPPRPTTRSCGISPGCPGSGRCSPTSATAGFRWKRFLTG